MNDDTDYTTSGFDKLLSRDGSQSLQGSLDQETPNRSLPLDRTQVTGPLGDAVKIGNILLDGVNSRIIMNDGTNDVLLIGEDV